MSLIYEPKGKAREYSPLALNIYNGCDHNCKYCYLKCINSNLSKPNPTKRNNLIQNLEKELKRNNINKQILLSFSGDPYCSYEMESGETRKVLEVLLKYQILIAILTKGGKRCLRDIDIFKKFDNIKIGATLTFDNEQDSKEWEVGAANPKERLKALEILHDNKIKTFASFEPVIKPKQSLGLMEKTINYIDQYKIGKINHYKGMDKNIDWIKFGKEAVKIMRSNKKDFYIKHDLRKYLPENYLSANEKNMDYLSLKKVETKKYQMSLI